MKIFLVLLFLLFASCTTIPQGSLNASLSEIPINLTFIADNYSGFLFLNMAHLPISGDKPVHSNAIIVLDEKGEVIFSKELQRLNAIDFKAHDEEEYSYHQFTRLWFYADNLPPPDQFEIRDYERRVFLDSNFSQTRNISGTDDTILDGHELLKLENGNYLIMGNNFSDEVINSSFRSMLLNHYDTIDEKKIHYIHQYIHEITPTGKILKRWSTHEHPSTLNETLSLANFTMERLLLYDPSTSKVGYDYFHLNSYDYRDGLLLLSPRHLNQIILLNWTSGEIIWTLGANGNFTFKNDPLNGFSQQHTARFTSNNSILIFDNGNDHTPQVSRVVEYEIDESKMEATLIWNYTQDSYSWAAGSAQRLPNNNTLIGWGISSDTLKVTEITPDKEKILEIHYPGSYHVYRATKFFPSKNSSLYSSKDS